MRPSMIQSFRQFFRSVSSIARSLKILCDRASEQEQELQRLIQRINENTETQRELNSKIVTHLLDVKRLDVEKERVRLWEEENSKPTPYDLRF